MEKSKPVVKKGLYTLPIWCVEDIINYGEAKQFFPTEYSRGTGDRRHNQKNDSGKNEWRFLQKYLQFMYHLLSQHKYTT